MSINAQSLGQYTYCVRLRLFAVFYHALFCSNAYFDSKDIGDALILYLSSGIHFTRTASVSV